MSFPFPLPLLLDGATGTELQKCGMPLNACGGLWVLEHPEALMEIQRAYARAGSQAVFAPTFDCNRPTLDKHRLDMPVDVMCEKLVALSRQAVGPDVLVGGDLFPCGLQMEPFGPASFEDIVAVFREQAQALEQAGVDFFCVETQINLAEARAIVTAVKQSSDKPVFVSFSCGSTGRSLWGDDLAEAAAELESMGVAAYGINCCGDLELLTRLVADIRPACSLPILVKPNAGLPVMKDGRAVYHMTPELLASHIPALRAAGASIFGGCCGTHAGHISAIRAALNASAE